MKWITPFRPRFPSPTWTNHSKKQESITRRCGLVRTWSKFIWFISFARPIMSSQTENINFLKEKSFFKRNHWNSRALESTEVGCRRLLWHNLRSSNKRDKVYLSKFLSFVGNGFSNCEEKYLIWKFFRS